MRKMISDEGVWNTFTVTYMPRRVTTMNKTLVMCCPKIAMR
jgi:hypothetical protein